MKESQKRTTSSESNQKSNDENKDAEQRRATFEKLSEKTRGIWKKGDGLKYQMAIRKEWDHRP